MAKKAPKPKKKTTAVVKKKGGLRAPVRKKVGRAKTGKPAKPREKKYRPAYKSVPLPEQTIQAALNAAFLEIDELKDEMGQIVDNMSGMEHLPKYETAENAQQELEQHCEAPDVPEALKDKTIKTLSEMVPTRKGRGTGRSMRLSNATSIIQDVIEFLTAIDLADDVSKAEREAAVELKEALEEHENIDVEFPGMFG